MNKIIGYVALVVAILALCAGLVGGNQSGSALGAVGTRFPHGLTIGSSGTNQANLIVTTCNLVSDASWAASTTLPVDCAVTGVTSSYGTVIAQLSSTTVRSAGGMSWAIVGAKASTTAGYVTVLLQNNGTAATPSATSVGSSTSIIASLSQ